MWQNFVSADLLWMRSVGLVEMRRWLHVTQACRRRWCHGVVTPQPPLLPVPYPYRMCNFGSAAVPPRLVNLETQQTGAPSAWRAALPAVPDSFAWLITESVVLSCRACARHICVWRCEQKLLIWAVLFVVGRGSRGRAAARHAGVCCSFTFGP